MAGKWCTAKHFEPDVTCELRHRHDGMHRAEFAKPVAVEPESPFDPPKFIAQVVSWE